MREIHSRIEKDGTDRCFLPQLELNSESAMIQIIRGKRVILGELSNFKDTLARRVKNKNVCGYHLGSESFARVNYAMLFNKKFDRELKNKINIKYEITDNFIIIMLKF